MLAIAGFLFASWLATKVSKLAGVSSIVLEITTGVVFGPGVLGLVSDEYAECEHKRHMNCEVPASFDELVAAGESFGPTLDKIAAMGYCDPHNWHHSAHAHGEGEPHHGDADSDAHSVEAEPHGDDAAHTDHHHHGAEPGASDAHATTPPPSASGTTPPASATAARGSDLAGQEDDEGDRPVRRLSGGGGGGAQYGSYAECLTKSCEAEVSHHCGLTPDVFTLIGHAGVALMIFESGMHFDFEKAKVVGPKACLVAVVGTILPLISGTLLTVAYGKPFVPDGVSVGTALAPTSVGIALRLLGEAGVLSHDFGQAIITAAFVDDILSLVLFNVLFSLKGDFDVFKVVVSPLIGIAFMLIAMVLAVKFWPTAINDYILPRIPIKKGDFKVSSSDEALFLIMFTLLVVYATTTHFLGTHLWGCFIAGMSFACVKPLHHPHHVWVKQTKRITSWMIRIFFAATVAFSIPVGQLLSIEAFLKGSLMGIVPCIASKVVCAPFMGDARFVIGWAMVGRAEFAYLIAQMAAASNMIDEETFSITIWALLYATIFAPFIFRTVLKRYIERNNLATEPAAVNSDDDDEEEEDVLEEKAGTTVKAPEENAGSSKEAQGATKFGRDIAELKDIELNVEGEGPTSDPSSRRRTAPASGHCGLGLARCFTFNNTFSRE